MDAWGAPLTKKFGVGERKLGQMLHAIANFQAPKPFSQHAQAAPSSCGLVDASFLIGAALVPVLSQTEAASSLKV